METRREFLASTAAGGIAGIIAYGVAPAFAKEVGDKKEITLEQAWKVHKKCLIIDGHDDTLVTRFIRTNENPLDWMKRDLSWHLDIPRMKEGGQRYSAFFNVGDGPRCNIWMISERLFESIEKYPQDIMKVLSSKDMVKASKTGRVGVIMYTEGPTEWFDGKIEILHILYRLGLRGVNISHGEGGNDPQFMQGSPSLSYSHPYTLQEREDHRKNAVGLTPFGLEVVKANNELGIVTDTAHSNDKAFYDVMEHSTIPPIMSHTAVFSIGRSARGMTDDQIKALAAKGGVMGIIFVPMFIDPDPQKASLDRLVDHIIYVRDLVGIDTVGIGTDYDGTAKIVEGVEEVSKLVNLTQRMLARGLTEEEVQKVWGGNFLRVLEQTIDKPLKKT